MADDERETRPPWLPPRWFIRFAWPAHRGLYRATSGRIGLWRPRNSRWGAMRLTATGRRTGRRRSVILAYVEDGPNLVTLAMNGWGAGEPAWWLNLLAHQDAAVRLAGGSRLVRARVAADDERSRLWARWRETDKNLDAYAVLRTAGRPQPARGRRAWLPPAASQLGPPPDHRSCPAAQRHGAAPPCEAAGRAAEAGR